jgi:hypothetical protein
MKTYALLGFEENSMYSQDEFATILGQEREGTVRRKKQKVCLRWKNKKAF